MLSRKTGHVSYGLASRKMREAGLVVIWSNFLLPGVLSRMCLGQQVAPAFAFAMTAAYTIGISRAPPVGTARLRWKPSSMAPSSNVAPVNSPCPKNGPRHEPSAASHDLRTRATSEVKPEGTRVKATARALLADR